MWDVLTQADCAFGTINHQSDLFNNSLVNDLSGYAKIANVLPVLNQTPSAAGTSSSGNAANGVDPYYGTPSAWTKSNCTMSAITDSTNPVPNIPATNNTIQIVYSASGGYAQVGANATYAGGQIWVTFLAKVLSGNAVINWTLTPNTGTTVSGQFVLDTTYRAITLQCPNNIAAGYSVLTFISSVNATNPTVYIAGLNVTTTLQPMPLTFKNTYGTAIPSSGYWNKGDIVQNSTPTVGQPKSWVCTVSGTSGTWVSQGNL